MSFDSYRALREAIVVGTARLDVTPLDEAHLSDIAWSGTATHLENITGQLQRVNRGEVEYLALRAAGHAVCKGGIDFAKEPDSGTIWQLATHPQLEGIGLATRLIGEFEARAHQRGIRRLRLAVETDNARARRLYEHIGYHAMGKSEVSWEAESPDGSRFVYTTTVIEMYKDT